MAQPLGVKVGQSASPLPTKKMPKSGKIGGKREEEGKIRKKRENREEKDKSGRVFFFTLPLLTDRAGYAIELLLTYC